MITIILIFFLLKILGKAFSKPDDRGVGERSSYRRYRTRSLGRR